MIVEAVFGMEDLAEGVGQATEDAAAQLLQFAGQEKGDGVGGAGVAEAGGDGLIVEQILDERARGPATAPPGMRWAPLQMMRARMRCRRERGMACSVLSFMTA